MDGVLQWSYCEAESPLKPEDDFGKSIFEVAIMKVIEKERERVQQGLNSTIVSVTLKYKITKWTIKYLVYTGMRLTSVHTRYFLLCHLLQL